MKGFCRWTSISVVVSALALGACAEGAEETPPNGSEKPEELFVGGARPARVYLPETLDDDKAYPVAVMLHGFSVNGMLQNAIFDMVARVDRFDFVLIVPEGTKNNRNQQFWNASPECCDFDGMGVDDVAYLAGLIEEVADHVKVDEERVSFFGHSNGGYMSMRMACERPDLVRRIVSFAGSLPVDDDKCANPGGTRVMHVHGTLDDVVPYYNNVDGTPGDRHGIRSKGAEDTVARWAAYNGCDEDTVATSSEDYFRNPGAETQVREWSDCQDGAVVQFLSVEGGDHFLAGASAELRDRIAEFLTGRD